MGAGRMGGALVGSGHPVVVQSMTNTDTADAAGTAAQVAALARAGSQIVRVTVNNDEAARAEDTIGAWGLFLLNHPDGLREHDAREALVLGPYAIAQVIEVVQQGTELGDMALGYRRQAHGLAAAVDELDVEPCLEQLNAP